MGRINFKQMSRYSKHCEQRHHNQFKEKFDSMTLTASPMNTYISKRIAVTFDLNRIERSCRKAVSPGKFWYSSDQCAKQALEIFQVDLFNIDSNHSAENNDPDNLKIFVITQIEMIENNTCAFYAIVNPKSLKTDILLLVKRKTDEIGKTIQLFKFPKNTDMITSEVLAYYHFRCQMEFNFRDSKQATGLNYSQANDVDILYFHFNASLTTVNIIKAIYLSDKNKAGKPFSRADYQLYHNTSLLNRFNEAFGIKPIALKSHHHVNEQLFFETKAA